MGEHFESKSSSFISFGYCVFYISEIAGYSGDSQYSSNFLFRISLAFPSRKDVLFFSDVGNDGRVYVSASGILTSPSRGSNPMEVSIHFPLFMADTDAPLPRWQVISLRSSRFTLSIFEALSATYL